MAGPETPELAAAAVEGGADLLEIGFPVLGSARRRPGDPPRRRAGARPGHADGGLPRLPRRRCAARVDVPLIPMTYASLLETYGYERFERDARAAGATGFIVADLPIEAHPELRRVQLVAPTTPTERIRLAAERTDGWLYLVSVTGTTGARSTASAQLPDLVARARAVTDVPLYAGFGIAGPEQAVERRRARRRDRRRQPRGRGRRGGTGRSALRELVASLREAIDSR